MDPIYTLNLKLSPTLRALVARRVAGSGYSSANDYVTDLLRRDADREKKREFEKFLLDRLDRTGAVEMDDADFKQIRRRFTRRIRRGKTE